MTRLHTSAFASILVFVLCARTLAAGFSEAGMPLRISGPISVEHQPDTRPVQDSIQNLLDSLRTFPAGLALESQSPAPYLEPETALSAIVEIGTDCSESSVTELPVEDSLESSQAPLIEIAEESEVPAPIAASERLPLGQSGVAATMGGDSGRRSDSNFGSIARTVGATGVVIALIILLRFAFVKLSGTTGGLRAQLGAAGKAPSGVLFVLGRYPISRGMSLVLLQLDQRVLLLSQTGDGFETLAELTDPDEVASIIRKVRDESGESLSSKFGGMLRKFESDPQTIEDLEPAAATQPVRLRYEQPLEDRPSVEQTYRNGYCEPKPLRTPSTGEDELRSRINRLREYGA